MMDSPGNQFDGHAVDQKLMMDEARFLSLMKKARAYSYLGANIDYWHGYQRGLRRGFQGHMYGTDAEHQRWLRLADEGADRASRERGYGYRDGLSAFATADEGGSIAGSPLRHNDSAAADSRVVSRPPR